MTLVCESLGGGDAALPLAPLVEFCHNASLIHDDIEDNSDERRGKPAIHLVHGTDAAINGGAFLYFLALPCIEAWASRLPANRDPCRARAYALWGEYMRRLHLGQAMDIRWHRDFLSLPKIDEYLAMCGLKTGCLARFAAALGVFAAEAAPVTPPPAQDPPANRRFFSHAAEALGEAAENLGIGFQILDDVKNLRGGIAGKKRGDDVVEGKKSLPVLLFLHRYTQHREMAARCFAAAREKGTAAPEVEELIQALENAGALDEAQERGAALIAKAGKTLAGTGFAAGESPSAQEARALLADFAGLIS
jgi:octaprenyl-diphosphate synthase